MTALIARQYIDGSKADTPSGVSVANFQLGLGNAWDCLQTLGVGLAAVVAGTTALTQANAGLLLIDATAGNVILNLPAASAAVGAVFQFKRLDSTANTVTINRAGSDTIDGSTSFTLNSQFDYQEIRGDGTSAWRVTTPKPLVAATAGIATAYTVTTTPKVLAQADTRIQVTWNVSNGGVACTLAANGGTAYGIKQYDSTGTKIDPTIVAAVKSDLVFDGTNWVILDPLPPLSNSRQIQSMADPTLAANAMTLPASTHVLDFRSSTLGSGAVTTVTGTAAALTIPSGATLGMVSGQQGTLVEVILNNGGVLEKAVVNRVGGNDLSETGVISTTAMSASATAANVFYSNTARTNVPYRVVRTITSTQAAAGTWVTAPSLVQGQGGLALAAMQSLGYGQTPQFVTRGSGVTYYNTTGKPIYLTVSGGGGGALGQVAINLVMGGTSLSFNLAVVSAGTGYGGGCVIPIDAAYTLTDTNISTRTTVEIR